MVQVPDTPAVIADIIGKAGSMVAEIEKKTGSQINIEKYVLEGGNQCCSCACGI